ncbi:Chromosome segregation in meiosis protein 3 [Daldinia childiae]|uniref:Chromosome segregation in meiosis protein 3 n=1 Tax=Daldinia childiae TaxID=326645 RepID=UPI0014455001|nr:Chromosome segregation in meiosis protein 3 [Daldinia childiae]KAF3055160.1 Chromosome segregation in meiosis protein 3 [Daldinia childiae]
MASRGAQKPSSALKKPVNDIDNYDVDDDPFAESGNEAPSNDTTQSKKRKDATGLGIDEAVAVQKKVRAPIVKLDEGRLLSEKGIPRLRRKARDLKFKGKGHEFSDAARLLSFYQLWFDDLFPKAKFLDAAAMAEKAGHKKYMRMKRMEWIEEGKPKPAGLDGDDDDLFGDSHDQPEERAPAVFPARIAPLFQDRGSERAHTPIRDDVPDDNDDIYGATPQASRITQPASKSLIGSGSASTRPASASLFGNGDEPDEDDLDALMAEEEAQRTKPTSVFGNGGGKPSQSENELDEDDLDALMAEAETHHEPPKQASNPTSRPSVDNNEEDDLDALMAEAENQEQTKRHAGSTPKETKEVTQNTADADEEEAMAEMDGLW